MKTIRTIMLALCVLWMFALVFTAKASALPSHTASTGPIGDISRIYIMNDKMRIETPRGSAECTLVDVDANKKHDLITFMFGLCTEGYTKKTYGKLGAFLLLVNEVSKGQKLTLLTKKLPELKLAEVAELEDAR